MDLENADIQEMYVEEPEKEEQNEMQKLATMRQEAELIKWQMDFSDILEYLKHTLQGESLVYDSNTGAMTWKKITKAMASQEAIHEIISCLLFFNKNTVLSNLTDQEISLLLFDLRLDLAQRLLLKKEELKLNTKDCTMLVDLVVSFMLSALKRAYLAGERNTLRYTSQTILRSPPEKHKKFLFF